MRVQILNVFSQNKKGGNPAGMVLHADQITKEDKPVHTQLGSTGFPFIKITTIMALAQSNMMELGTKAPDFTLFDTISQKPLSLSQLKSNVATVVVFICNHCPFVHHINHKLVEVAYEYQAKGIQFIAINSNDVEYFPEEN